MKFLYGMLSLYIDLCCFFFYSPSFTHTEKVLGIKIRIFGFKGRFKKRSVIIMNHVSHFDWMFFWSVVDRHGDYSSWKVVMKEKPLRQLPILGRFEYVLSAPSLSPFSR